MSTATIEEKRRRLDELGNLVVLQGCNPDQEILTPELQAEADQIGLELEEAQAEEAEAQAEAVPESPEVGLTLARSAATPTNRGSKPPRVTRRGPRICGSIGIDITKPIILTEPSPTGAKAQSSARESRGSATRTRGSRRGSTRSSSRGGDSGDSDSDEPAGGGLQRSCTTCPALLPPGSAPQRRHCDGCRKRRDRDRHRANRRLTDDWTPADDRFKKPIGTSRATWEEAIGRYVRAANTLGDRLCDRLLPDHYLDLTNIVEIPRRRGVGGYHFHRAPSRARHRGCLLDLEKVARPPRIPILIPKGRSP